MARTKSKNGLNNIQNACVFIHLMTPVHPGIKSTYPAVSTPEIKRYMYLQRKGTIAGYTSGWYNDYFRLKGTYVKAGYNVGKLWFLAGRDPKTNAKLWYLTPMGRSIATTAIGMLERRNNCKINQG